MRPVTAGIKRISRDQWMGHCTYVNDSRLYARQRKLLGVAGAIAETLGGRPIRRGGARSNSRIAGAVSASDWKSMRLIGRGDRFWQIVCVLPEIAKLLAGPLNKPGRRAVRELIRRRKITHRGVTAA
jgi:hypothetical protein